MKTIHIFHAPTHVATKDKTMTTQLREKIETLDLQDATFRDLIYLAEEYGVLTSHVIELIEQRKASAS